MTVVESIRKMRVSGEEEGRVREELGGGRGG